MGAAAEMRVEAELATDVWTDITPDTNGVSGLRIAYGINGNRPLDMVAGTGECSFVMQNHAGNSGAQQGYYSPLHASVRSGWTPGVALRVIFHRTSDTAQSVSSLTRSGSTATVTTAAAHGYATDDWITIAGANETEYNGTFKITKTGASTFTYTVDGSPTTPATGTITARLAYIKHRGKMRVVDPDPGQFLSQLAPVVSYDGMRDLAEADCREVALQIDKGEDDLLTAVCDSVPAASQPVARSFDAGVDTFPYAFDEVGRGTKALSVCKDIADSAFALIFMRGDGTLRLQSRNTRASGTSAFTFTDTAFHGLSVPADLDKLRNLVRVSIRPREVDAVAADQLVYSTAGDKPFSVVAGTTLTQWIEWRDPTERTKKLIGALGVITTLVADTDFQGNSAEDGTGSDLSADLTITVTAFASTAKTEIQNTGPSTVYLVSDGVGAAPRPAIGKPFFQIRGKGVYDLGPQTYEATSVQSYGTRPLDVTLKYQGNPSTAQSYADYLEGQYSTLIAQMSSIEFLANESDDLLKQALQREPGDIITITEPVTGATTIDAVIHSVQLEVTPGPWIRCRWGLSPAAPFQAWLLGVAGRGELGDTTRLGF